MKATFQERISYQGDISVISKHICDEYHLGNYVSEKVILVGYEDFNLMLETTQGKFFVKIFADFRDDGDCQEYIEKIVSAINAGVSTPRLLESSQSFLHSVKIDEHELHLCVMDFIDGQNYYDLKKELTADEIRFLARQASIINSIDFKPKAVYDSWAIVHFKEEFEKKGAYLSQEDRLLIEPLLQEFDELSIDLLPHCFVHGDIIRTNLMKNDQSELFIIDFAVANYYPRIQELAVLACDLLFNAEDASKSEQNLSLALEEYQKRAKLTKEELEALPIYIKIAHAMHLLCANYENVVERNNSSENNFWLTLGKKGLRQLQAGQNI